MRKIVAGLFMSLDGVVESPEQWAYQYGTDQMWADIAAGVGRADGVLLGRRTYQQFAQMWPGQPSDVAMAAFLNNTHKYVVSATLDTLGWRPASLLAGDLADELTELRRRPGKNIQIPGSPTLVRSLLTGGLLDELSLTICPVVVGPGMRLFQDMTDRGPLTLAQSKTFSTGALGLTYQPGNAQLGVGYRLGKRPGRLAHEGIARVPVHHQRRHLRRARLAAWVPRGRCPRWRRGRRRASARWPPGPAGTAPCASGRSVRRASR